MNGVRSSTFMRRIRRLPPLETGLLVIALAVLVSVALVRQRTERVAPGLDSYSTYDAASGGYGALYELLAREGVRVERFEQRPAFLGADVDTLVWAEPLRFDTRQIVPTQADVRALEDWVRAGGRLLYLGFDDAAAKAGLLALPSTQPAAARQGRVSIATTLARAGVRRVAVSAGRRYRGSRRGMRVLFDDGRGPVVVAYTLGRGTVTAVIDESPFTNAALARGDHARLATLLGRPSRSDARVGFDETVHGYAVPERWWQVVPRPLAIALFVAALALIAAFAGTAVRLGPPLLPEPPERTTAEFIAALGSLFERGRATRYALETGTHSTSRCIARGLGLSPTANGEDIAAAIEDGALRATFRALVSVARIEAPSERDLVRGMALAQRLRKEFAHGRSRH